MTTSTPAKASPNRPAVSIFGTKLTPCTSAELLDLIALWVQGGDRRLILSGNAHSYNLAHTHPWLRRFMNEADIIRLDGAGVRFAARLLGYATPPRVTWADFAWDLAAFAEPRGFTVFFLGGRPGVADKAGARLLERSSNLRLVGTHHGYFDKTTGSLENETVLEAISSAKPNILIVGFGMPVQERWLMENWDRIEADVILSAGAMFDYVSGELQRGPRWMTDHGLEWLARLIIEPRRLWKRYLIGNPLFLWRVLKQRFGLLHLPEEDESEGSSA